MSILRTEPIIGVADVQKSSAWYQQLLICKSAHVGTTFEVLVNETNTTVLCLHRWGDHEHPTLLEPKSSVGNGLILYFRVENLDETWKNAQALGAIIEALPGKNPNSGMDEFAIRDLDGYYLLISL